MSFSSFRQNIVVLFSLLSVSILSTPSARAAPASFQEAKKIARQYIYHDQNLGAEGTLYCGCHWQWTTQTGGTPDLKSCGYQIRAQQVPATRIEWEHVVPAWVFGHQLQCWQHGGRKNCEKNDPVFKVMEADLFNLAPSVGEVNQDRSNFRYGLVTGGQDMYGMCQSKTDFKRRVFEPRDHVKGEVARITFYMYDRYNLHMSEKDQKILMAWDKQYPVSAWERQRDNRINAFMGHHNEFVTGTKTWTLNYQPEGKGLENRRIVLSEQLAATRYGTALPQPQPQGTAAGNGSDGKIIGNRKSRLYHLKNCPSYDKVAASNRIYFDTEAQALSQGFRKAKNCSK